MIKKGLKVIVLAGKDKKKEGEIIEIDRQSNRAKVKDINMVKKHIKTTKEKKGGIVSIESFINLSNLKLISSNLLVSSLNWSSTSDNFNKCLVKTSSEFWIKSEELLFSFVFNSMDPE